MQIDTTLSLGGVMKMLVLIISLVVLLSSCTTTYVGEAETGGVVNIPSSDGYVIEGFLSLPEDGNADTLVVYVNGSGPNTYDNKRKLDEEKQFTYFDLFRDEFKKRDIAFFSYNTRGVTVSDEPPYFTSVDDEVYKSYTPPHASVNDVVAIVDYMRAEKGGFDEAKIILLGWSEGTLIAPLVSLKTSVDGLILCGFMYDDMMTILDWQQLVGRAWSSIATTSITTRMGWYLPRNLQKIEMVLLNISVLPMTTWIKTRMG